MGNHQWTTAIGLKLSGNQVTHVVGLGISSRECDVDDIFKYEDIIIIGPFFAHHVTQV